MKTMTLAALLVLASAASADTTAKAPNLDPAAATATAPAVYKVKMVTTKGDFTIEVHRDWAPLGADRFYNLVKSGYFADIAFFRVVKGFMVQFGIHGDPAVNMKWRPARIQDDPTGKQSNTRGMVTFAMGGPNTRTTQVFINYVDNGRLDSMGFPPFGKVIGEGMKVVDAIEGMYGEGAPQGRGPAQGRIQNEGNAYLKAEFPKMDYLKSASIVP
jgi:peptidyl-prolyl cis-trans isomerase A (cyclophilin A)